MKRRNLKLLAGIGAFALGMSVMGQAALAQLTTIDSGDDFTVDVQTEVLNSFDVTVAPLNFGTFGTVTDGGETASIQITPGGAFSKPAPSGGDALIVAGGTDHAVATVAIQALPDTRIFAAYSNVHDLTFTDPDGTHVLDLRNLSDNLGGQAGGFVTTGHNGGVTPNAGTPTIGNGVTTGLGVLNFGIGGVIGTRAQGTNYPSGTYEGSFDLTLSY
jgi:hypothetical protein